MDEEKEVMLDTSSNQNNSVTDAEPYVSDNVSGKELEEEYDEVKPSPSHEDISPLREALFILLICLTQLLTQASLSETVIPVQTLAKHFKVEHAIGEQSWFTSSFSLTVGTFILISGRLGDLYGYKKIYIIAYVVLSMACLITGFTVYSTSTVFFDVFRSLQGLGLSLAFPNSVALIGHYYPRGTKRIIFMCCFGAVAPAGFVIGSFFSNIFVEKVWWPWAFWTFSLVSIFIAFAAYFVIPHNIGSHNSPNKGSFDYLGGILGMIGLILINFSFNEGPNVGWEKPYVYVLLIVGFIAMGLFFYVERRTKFPLVPNEVLKGETGMVLACIFAGWSSFGVWLVYSTRSLLELDHLGVFVINARYIPTLIMGFIAAATAALTIHKLPVSVIMIMSMVAFFLGNLLNGLRPVGQIYWAQFFVSSILTPFGMDMSFPAATIVLSHNLPQHQQGVAASLVATFVNYSIAIGLGFAGTVEYYTTKDLPSSMATTELGIRNALRMGMGLAGLGIVVAVIFAIYEFIKSKRSPEAEKV